MAHEHSLGLVAELEGLVPSGSKAQPILARLKSSLAAGSSPDYTKARASKLQQTALRMLEVVQVARKAETSYADRAASLSAVSDSYLRLVHAFKTDPKMWSLAQTELVPTLTKVADEAGIDASLEMLEIHLGTYLNSLDFWLEK